MEFFMWKEFERVVECDTLRSMRGVSSVAWKVLKGYAILEEVI